VGTSYFLAIFGIGAIGILTLTAVIIFLMRGFSQVNIRLQERDQSTRALHDSVTSHQLQSLKLIQESIQNNTSDMRTQIVSMLQNNTEELSKRVDKLTENTGLRLQEISAQVEKRLSEGFEKTNNIFTDIIKRLALIDEAQKKIAELSSNVVSLQEILSDKTSRGAFGEVQLSSLIHNMIPENFSAFQYQLSNGKRADCILFLPEPTGNVVIDAKFPLESYRRLSAQNISSAAEKREAEQQFRVDIRKHLTDISGKYIIPNETADGAMMFIPAEAIFAEIHANYPDLIELSHKLRVWLVSPTTMMAILTTARAVLKDAATRQQIHAIQEHLVLLGKDFERFQERMDSLAKHINQAYTDVEQVQKSSQKITSRFLKIEQADLKAIK
jgi:DNA recombination protein RmuC